MMPRLSIVIPTYGRDEVLTDSLGYLMALAPRAAEILVVDQTIEHDPATHDRLAAWNAQGDIRWLRLPRPSITYAMNTGLRQAVGDIVLFLDDDIIPAPDLVERHLRNYESAEVVAVVGQVLQPGQGPVDEEARHTGEGLTRDLAFRFHNSRRCSVGNCMAGNLSVRRAAALSAGGLDENFLGVAYRFETEFCRRLERTKGAIIFDGSASIRHLQAGRGGTRAYGNPLCSVSPNHGVGDYYFALREGGGFGEILGYFLSRLFKTLGRKFYIRHPWCLPGKLVGEVRAMALAFQLSRRPPGLVKITEQE